MTRLDELLGHFPRRGPPSADAWNVLMTTVGRAVAEGDQAFLFALVDAAQGHPQLGQWAAELAFRGAGLIPEAGALRRFLERARTPPPRATPPQLPDYHGRVFGALLANAQPDDLLERELEFFGLEPRLREVFACWVQERVLRGSEIGRSPFVERFWAALPSSHPLAALPLVLQPLERGAMVPSSRPRDLFGNWFDFASMTSMLDAQPEGAWRGSTREVAVDAEALGAVLNDPRLAPNARLEARAFELLGAPATLAAVSLEGLGLECTQGAPVRVRAVEAREAMVALLLMGTLGGAYCEARSAAHGRALAWRSLRAFVGAGEDVEAETRARRCQWLRFEADSAWYFHVVFDWSLACLAPDGRLTVLAATDSD